MSNEFLKNNFVGRIRTTEEIRELIRCPQLGSKDYGKWGALPLEVRFTLHNLVVLLDNEIFCYKQPQQRIDKAIEYINKNILISFDKVGFKTDKIAGIVVDNLLNILNGGDE